MTDPKKAFKDIASFTLSAGVAYASGLLPMSFVSNIIGEVAKGLTSDYIRGVDYKKIKALLGTVHPSELNHDLQKLIIKSIEWSIKNIELLYIEKFFPEKYQVIRLKKFNDILIKQVQTNGIVVRGELFYQKVENISETGSFLQMLQIDPDQFPEVKHKNSYGDFFKEQFPEMLKLCFGELLKKEENREALIAYQRTIKNSIEQKLDTILEKLDSNANQGSQEIDKASIMTLKEKVSQTQLDDFVITINAQYETITRDLSHLKNSFNLILRELDTNYFERNRVYILGGGSAMALMIAIMAHYIFTLPYNALISVQVQPGLEIHPRYPSWNEADRPRIIFHLDAPIEKELVPGGITLTNLRPKYRDQKVYVELIDEYWTLPTDSIRLDTESIVLPLVPNEKMATVTGNVFSHIGHRPIPNASIRIRGLDLETHSGPKGEYSLSVPMGKRQKSYVIEAFAEGYESVSLNCGLCDPLPISMFNQ